MARIQLATRKYRTQMRVTLLNVVWVKKLTIRAGRVAQVV
jgi:hypothetical protein